MRHPLYLANYIMVLGMAMFFHTWWIVALVTCACILYYERIIFAEESFLSSSFGEQFERWSAVTPAIVPDLTLWRSSNLPFSWRSVLRREYTGLALVTTIFPLMEITGDSIAEKHLKLDWPWLVLAGLGLVAYFVLRSLKKYTQWLDVEGR
ncbi:MAG: methyltransferase [Verrucomicrobiota bacterium]